MDGKVVAYRTHFITNEQNARTYIDNYFEGYGFLFDLRGTPLEIVIFESGKITYSSEVKDKNEGSEKIEFCVKYQEFSTDTFKNCMDLYAIEERGYNGFMNALLLPFSQQTIGAKSMENFINHLTPDSLKSQGK